MMTIMDAIRARHSVRGYQAMDIPVDALSRLRAEVEACNREGCLHIQLITKEPKAFSGFMAHYGKFENVKNYIAIVGNKNDQEKAGYYGEKIVLKCPELGLNTCWVAMTYGKSKAEIKRGQKLLIIISLGYGKTQGVPHKSKSIAELGKAD